MVKVRSGFAGLQRKSFKMFPVSSLKIPFASLYGKSTRRVK
tara:strand:+ start:218 stop:340 length:123 start_codon:yes stop_codon:yes gene_type:complete